MQVLTSAEEKHICGGEATNSHDIAKNIGVGLLLISFPTLSYIASATVVGYRLGTWLNQKIQSDG